MLDRLALGPLAAGMTLPFLGEVVGLLVACVLVAYLCYRAGLVPIAGFLLAGVLVGPGGLGLVQDEALVASLAEIGVILLLFTIGLEFSLEQLARIQRIILVGGGLQVGVTIALTAALALAFGVDARAAVFTGALVALSSTAIVLGLLAERSQMASPLGQHALGILIFQDLAIVAMVLLVPLLGEGGGSLVALGLALAKAVALLVVVLVAARRAVPWLLDRIAGTRHTELFLLAVVSLCFGTAWVTSLAGVSLALGAFLAGLVISEGRYRAQALGDVLPLRIVFNAAFFVSVGMLLNVGFLVRHVPLVLGAAAAAVVLKAVVTTASVLVLRVPARIAVGAGLLLAQIGEFSFVLNVAGREAGLSPLGLGVEGEQTFIAATVLLMILTPFLADAGPHLGAWVEARLGGPAPEPLDAAAGDGHGVALEDHVVIVGYGVAGKQLAHVLQQAGLPFAVVELNARTVADAQAEGLPVVFGDACRTPVLEAVAIERAKLCVIAINDRDATERIVQLAHHENPTLQVVARTPYVADVGRLHDAGAEVVVADELETAIRLFGAVLRAYGVPLSEVERHTRELRMRDYEVLLARDAVDDAHQMVLEGLNEEGLHTRAVHVRPGAPVAGRTLAGLDLRGTHGLTVLAVRRDEEPLSAPNGDFRVASHDRLVLLGPSEAFAEAADLFARPPTSARPPTARTRLLRRPTRQDALAPTGCARRREWRLVPEAWRL